MPETTLDAAIEAHPDLWQVMRDTKARAVWSRDAQFELGGMVRALCIVGKFDPDDVIERLG